jgi:hypothetical protein
VTHLSPPQKARIAGLLYLVIIVCGAFAEAFVRQRLVVPGDAAMTAANILAQEQIYRLGFVADLIPLLLNMLLAVIFFDLFKVVNKSVSALVVLFIVVGTAVQASALLYHLAPLVLLGGDSSWWGGALTPESLQAWVLFSLKLHTNGYNIALAFFGCYGLSLGYLIWHSTFMPRILGVLMAIAGSCYLVNSLLSFLAPSLSSIILLLPVLLGEGGLTLWLLAVGVNAQKWKVQATS